MSFLSLFDKGGFSGVCAAEGEAVQWRQIYYVFYDCSELCCLRSIDIKGPHCFWLWQPQR